MMTMLEKITAVMTIIKVADATCAVANVDDYSGSSRLLAATTLRFFLCCCAIKDSVSSSQHRCF